MKKAYYNIGQVTKNLTARFSITLKTANGFCINTTKPETFQVNNLYPSLTFTIRKENTEWSSDKEFSVSRFSAIRLVQRGKEFASKFISEKNLFGYINGDMVIDKDIANKIAFTEVVEFERKIRITPVIGKDLEMNQKYEGVLLMVGGVANYLVMTYDEFMMFITYLDRFDFDGLALKLLSLVVQEVEDAENSNVVEEKTTQDSVKWTEIKSTIDI